MEWERKVEMVRFLNNAKYEEAVNLLANEKDWDDQTIDMFANGFDITKIALLEPIRRRVLDTNVSENMSWHSRFRWAMIQETLT